MPIINKLALTKQVDEPVCVQSGVGRADAHHHAGAENSVRQPHLPIVATIVEDTTPPYSRGPAAPVWVKQDHSVAGAMESYLLLKKKNTRSVSLLH
jgi:hypothetical protein